VIHLLPNLNAGAPFFVLNGGLLSSTKPSFNQRISQKTFAKKKSDGECRVNYERRDYFFNMMLHRLLIL
jgi:hypothetical protein